MNPNLLSLDKGWKRDSSTDSKMSVAWLSHELYWKQLCRSCLPSFSLFRHCQDVEFTDRSPDSQYITAACQVVYGLGN
jgi:hypothetical protein